MDYVVFDAETTTKCPVGTFSAHPAWKDNTIVMSALCKNGEYEVIINDYVYSNDISHFGTCELAHVEVLRLLKKNGDMIVGHNLKFDLLYLFKCVDFIDKDIKDYIPDNIWDTQLAEYLLTGQQHMYSSLDELSAKYGGTLKDTYVSDAFKTGVPTEKIDKKKLEEYLIQDVLNTEIVFKAQLKRAAELGILPLIKTQMKALLGTTVMAHHGMVLDFDYISKMQHKLKADITIATNEYERVIADMVACGLLSDKIEYPIGSNAALSSVLYGGTAKWKEKEVVGTYKNGKPKEKLVDRTEDFVGLDLEPVGSKNKLGYYNVDAEVLKNIRSYSVFVTSPTGTLAHNITHNVLAYREAHKQLETYYNNLVRQHIWRYVHPNLSHVSTKTGRLSCTNPNLQNQTSDGGVKAAFVSRFEQGMLLELDYKQLEMIALAILSGDKALIQDIKDGVDMHSALYYEMYGRLPTKEERKPFKRLSFGLVYGAGYKSLAANAGVSESDAKKFIDVFYTRYSGVKEYHKNLVETARRCRALPSTPSFDSESKLPLGEYTMTAPTGRKYIFKEYANKKTWGPNAGKWETSFSPPELKNWPIQGFATGDIVPMMVGILVEELLKHPEYYNKVLPVVTVHDSIVLDVNIANVDIKEVAKFCKEILEGAPAYVKSVFNIDIDVPLEVEASAGTNWLDLSPINL